MTTTATNSEFAALVNRRRSARMFLRDKPVPTELLNDSLALATHAPSKSVYPPVSLISALSWAP